MNLDLDETEIQIIEISLFSIDGKKILIFDTNFILNIEGIATGVYLLNIDSSQGNFSKKIIKK